MKKIKVFSTKKVDVEMQSTFDDFEIESEDFIITSSIENESLKSKIQSIFQEKITAIFTSKNAVKSIAKIIDKSPDWDIYCIAPHTENAINTTWDKSLIKATAKNASELLPKIPIIANQKIIFFAGNRHLPIIPDYFKNKAEAFETIIVYETKEMPKKLDEEYDAYLFFSPSGVQSFFNVNKLSENAICVAIGATSAKALVTFAPYKILQASVPTIDSMLEQLNNYYAEK